MCACCRAASLVRRDRRPSVIDVRATSPQVGLGEDVGDRVDGRVIRPESTLEHLALSQPGGGRTPLWGGPGSCSNSPPIPHLGAPGWRRHRPVRRRAELSGGLDSARRGSDRHRNECCPRPPGTPGELRRPRRGSPGRALSPEAARQRKTRRAGDSTAVSIHFERDDGM